MVIQHNIPAINSHRNLGINNSATAKNLEKLSSGYRINRAGDDAAGLAISEKMRGQIRGLGMAEQNTANGISLIQTAEGGLNETHAILQRMRELAVQSANGTYQNDDRKQIGLEVSALKSEIDRIASSTNYNGINLLDGTMGGEQVSSLAKTQAALDAAITAAFGTGTEGLTLDFTLVDHAAGDSGILTATKNGTATVWSMQIGDKTYVSAASNAGDTHRMYLQGEVGDDTSFIEVKSGIVTADDITAGSISGINVHDMAAGDALNLVDATTKVSTSIYGTGVIGTATSELVFQIGANGSADQKVGQHVGSMASGAIGNMIATSFNASGTVAGIDITTQDAANAAIKVIDAATNMVSSTRANLGALQNRLEHTLNNLGVTKENLTAAESTIRDVDMAKEMMEFTKNNILVQASQSMLAQANALPQGVLSLLR